MKKLLLIFGIVGIMVACGKVELTTNEYKKDLLEKVLYKHDAEATKKYDEIIAKLKEQAKDGKEKAITELDKWNETEKEVRIFAPYGPNKDGKYDEPTTSAVDSY